MQDRDFFCDGRNIALAASFVVIIFLLTGRGPASDLVWKASSPITLKVRLGRTLDALLVLISFFQKIFCSAALRRQVFIFLTNVSFPLLYYSHHNWQQQ
jgi:hypothetical protein